MLIYLSLLDSEEEISKFELIYNTYKKQMYYTANILCGFGCFRGLDLRAKQIAQGGEHSILRRDSGRKSIIKILRYAVSKLCKACVFQQQIDHLCIDTPCVEVLCSLYGQAQFSNIVVLAVGDVGFSQQKIRGHVEQPCDFQHLFVGQRSLCTADEAADGAFRAADPPWQAPVG